MHRQPDCRLVRRRPLDPVLLKGRDVHEVARLQFQHFVLELQPRRPLLDDDPFVLRLVVPKIGGRSVAVRDDSFDTHVGGVEQRADKLVGQVGEEVGGCHGSSFDFQELPFQPASPQDALVEP